MKALQILMDRFWLIRDRERELYFQARREMDEIERFARDYPGWRVVNNERVIKLEKLPAHAKSYMGITEFQDKLDYAILCALLIFLEDREDGEAFLLSELIERVELCLKSYLEIDWTLFTQRKSLIRAMQYAERMGLLIAHEGDVDSVSGDIHHEVLYENTGLSRYYAVNFSEDVTGKSSYIDFERQEENVDTDRGHFRINRVYRSLATGPAMYWESVSDADSYYLKNQRQWVSKYLSEYLGGRLDIHRNAAFFIQEEDDEHYGELFPKDSTIADIVLLLCAKLREEERLRSALGEAHDTNMEAAVLSGLGEKREGAVHDTAMESAAASGTDVHDTAMETAASSGTGERGQDGTVRITRRHFRELVERCVKEFSAAWSKEYREMASGKLCQSVLDYMESWMMLSTRGEEIVLYPAVYKFAGYYPKDFDAERIAEREADAVREKENSDREPARKRGRRKKRGNEDEEGQQLTLNLM